MKKCSICKLEKDSISKSSKCRQCILKNQDKIKKYNQEYGKKYYQENKIEILKNKKEYYQENKIEILEERKEYYQENKDKKIEYNKEYYQENKENIIKQEKEYRAKNLPKIRTYHNKYTKERRIIDPNFRIRATVSANINFYLKSNNSSKNGASCLDYLPYTIEKLKKHLENQFESWMTWGNYGRYDTKTWNDNNNSTWTWQIDHIIPQSIFPYINMEEDNFKKCWALENLRPLSAKQNFMEGVTKIRHR